MKRLLLKMILAILIPIFLSCSMPGISSADPDWLPDRASEMLSIFGKNAAGRYFTLTDNGLTVLELIPAFGRLFASVGYYMGEDSLYSYYAAELIPVCRFRPEGCLSSDSVTSSDVYVRLFSNMSNMGRYWPGETRQRLTLLPDGLLLSGYSGDGDALVSKDILLLKRNEKVPGIMPYGKDDAEKMFGAGLKTGLPEALSGSWFSSLSEEGEESKRCVSLDTDGTLIFLRDQNKNDPPLLLKGGFTVYEEQPGSYLFCYLMSSPASGAMPYNGCVLLEKEGDGLIVRQSRSGYDDLLIPQTAAEVRYTRE